MARKAIYKHATQVDASSYPDEGSSPVGTNEWNESPDPQGMIGNTPATSTITIASGVLTVTDSVTVAAAEAAIGLAIIVVYYRNRGSIRVEDIHSMKG